MPFATKSPSYWRISLGVAASLLAASPVWGDVNSDFTDAPGHRAFGQDVLPGAVPPGAQRVFIARQSALCLSAIADAEGMYRVPHGLLAATSRVDTGLASQLYHSANPELGVPYGGSVARMRAKQRDTLAAASGK